MDYLEFMLNMFFFFNNDIGDICIFLLRRGIVFGLEKGMKWRMFIKEDWWVIIFVDVKKIEGIWIDIGENLDWSGNIFLE